MEKEKSLNLELSTKIDELNKNEKNLNIKIENLNKELLSEKNINKELKNKLEKISKENCKVLRQFEIAKKANKN